tara:strand:- start:4604 stop:6307 length:1704 start_codon:yes stop_codon:yes gene_type:complete
MHYVYAISLVLCANSTVSAAAQSDDCTSPPVITGVGVTPYTLIPNTTTTVLDPPCGHLGTSPDGYFLWTVPSDGSYVLRVESSSSIPVIISVFDGPTCGSPCLVSSYKPNPINAPQVIVTDCAAGESLLVHVGQQLSQPTTSGSLIVEPYPEPPPVNDDCMSPTTVTGFGPFPYDMTGATTSATAPPGNTVSRQDIYFEWFAPEADSYFFSFCPDVTQRRIHVFRGAGCTGSFVGGSAGTATCPPTGGGVFAGNAFEGERFLIRISASDYSFGAGEFLVTQDHPNNSCSSPLVVFDETSFVIDPSGASPSGFQGGAGTLPGCDPDTGPDTFFTWTPACDGEYTIAINSPVLIDVFLGSNCGATCLDSSAEPITIQAIAGQDYLIRWTPFLLASTMDVTITRTDSPCPDLVVETCVPATPHHEGGFVTLGNSDFELFQGVERLRVLAEGGPANEFGMLLVSAGAGSTIPLYQGVLCLDGPIGRYDPINAQNLNNSTINSVGSFHALTGDFQLTGAVEPGFLVPTFLPNPPGGSIVPGDQWYFQLWYRDQTPGGASSSNMSDVICVTFP